MRVIHLLYRYAVGGKERSVIRLCREMAKNPQVVCAVAFCANPSAAALAALHEEGIEYHVFGLRFGQDLRGIPGIRSVLKRYDIHHFHNLSLPLLLASRGVQGAKRVFTERGQTGHGLMGALLNRLYGVFLRRWFHAISANTRFGTEKPRELYRISQPVEVTYNGIPFGETRAVRTPAEVRAELGIGESHFVFGSCGRLVEVKRFHLLLEALAEVPDPKVCCLLVGGGPLRDDLEAKAKALGVGDRVYFTGERRDPFDYVQIMDLFALSTFEGGFENAVVEAMALGVPAVVWQDGGGAREHVVHGETGFIVSDASGLAEIVRSVRLGRVPVGEMGQLASAFVRERYSVERCVATYLNVYNSVQGAPASLQPLKTGGRKWPRPS